jgi:2-amino-4-hydroxy-6-hydroxymethyldihydropteridine diphosphokinase
LLKQVEDGQGRLHLDSNGHKSKVVSLDMDILLYGSLIRSVEKPLLPHPDIRRFAHVALPLLELDPNLRLADDGKLLSDIAYNLNKSLLNRVDSFILFRKI